MSNNQTQRSIVINFDDNEKTAGLSLEGDLNDYLDDEEFDQDAIDFQEDLEKSFEIIYDFIEDQLQGEMAPVEIESLLLMCWIQLVIATEEVDENVLSQLESRMPVLYKSLNTVLIDSAAELGLEEFDLEDEPLFTPQALHMMSEYVKSFSSTPNISECWKDNKWKAALFEKIQALFTEFDENELTDLSAIFTLATFYTCFSLLRQNVSIEQINKVMLCMPVVFDQLMSELYGFMEIESNELFE